jgi:peptidoglycan/xylan/chitin deacetylase (PgdA/CDA1 family)
MKELIALSFDDGPSSATPVILDLLRRHHAYATFFVVGMAIAGREDLLVRMVAEGHEIGNHTFSHPRIGDLSKDELVAELELTSDLIEGASGMRPRLMRPPYGVDAFAAKAVAKRLGMTTVLWSINPRDWREIDASEVCDLVLTSAKPGGVVVQHDGIGQEAMRERTVAALEMMLPKLTERGYRLVTISDILAASPRFRRNIVPRRREVRAILRRAERRLRRCPKGTPQQLS